MLDGSRVDTNKSIQAILNEYYGGESFEEDKDESRQVKNINNDFQMCSVEFINEAKNQSQQLKQSTIDNCEDKHQSCNVTPSTTRSNLSHCEQQVVKHELCNDNAYTIDYMNVCDSEVEANVEQVSSPDMLHHQRSIQSPFECQLESNFEHGPTAEKCDQYSEETLNQNNENPTMKQKKPFLKKGSRKEPSSLQRANKNVLKKGMRFSNEVDGTGNSKLMETRQNALAHLEKMQQEQLENLEKRIERRQQARKEIRQKRIDSRQSRTNTRIANDDDSNPDENDIDNTSSGSESDDNDHSYENSSDDGNSSVSSMDPKQQDETKRESPKKETVITSLKKRKTPLSQYKGKLNHQKNNRMDLKSPEMKEQWQVIKSMRKRQEAALRTAEKEREEVKSWANNERLSVQKWVEQQKALIQKEKKRATNELLASQRKKRHESLEERALAAAESSQKQLRSEIEELTETLQKHKIDSDATKSRFRLSEKRLKDSLTNKDNEITSLKDDIEELTMKYSKAQTKIDELSKMKSSSKRKKKQKKKIMDSAVQEKDAKKDHCFDDSAACLVDNKEKDQDEEALNTKSDEQHESNETLNSTSDEKAIEVIKNRIDLIEQPTEGWLRKHLHDDTSVNQGDGKSSDKLFFTPSKRKEYDPLKYSSTPQTVTSTEQNLKNRLPVNDSESFDNLQNLANDNRIVTYGNGTQKEMLPDGTKIVRFSNGDVKTTYSTIGIIVYYYAESKTSHTTHPDGLEIFEFASGQIERHYPNGRKEVNFPDGTQQTFLPNGDKVNKFPDGVNVLESHLGEKAIHQAFDQSIRC